jgi:hypothetical protein
VADVYTEAGEQRPRADPGRRATSASRGRQPLGGLPGREPRALLEQIAQGSRPLNGKVVAAARDLGVGPEALQTRACDMPNGDLRVRAGH